MTMTRLSMPIMLRILCVLVLVSSPMMAVATRNAFDTAPETFLRIGFGMTAASGMLAILADVLEGKNRWNSTRTDIVIGCVLMAVFADTLIRWVG